MRSPAGLPPSRQLKSGSRNYCCAQDAPLRYANPAAAPLARALGRQRHRMRCGAQGRRRGEHPLRPRRGPGDAASASCIGTSTGAFALGSQPSPRHHRQPPHLRVPRHPGHPQRSQAEHRSPGKIAPHAGDPRQLHPARRAESQITHPVHPSFHWLFLMAASCRHSSSAPSRRYAVLSSTIFPPSNSTDCSEPSS